MKVKHYAGYGTVNMQKVSATSDGEDYCLTVLVSGNHECGLVRTDKYDIFNWIVKHFDKTMKDYRQIDSVEYNEDYDEKTKTNTCTYTIKYHKYD